MWKYQSTSPLGSVCLMGYGGQTIVILQGYMCTHILFYLFIWLVSLALLLHLLCFAFCVLNLVFRKVSFFYCLLPFAFLLSAFYFCLLCLNFCILYFGIGFSHASSMIKRQPSTPSNFGIRQTYIQTDRQFIVYQIREGGGNRLIDR